MAHAQTMTDALPSRRISWGAIFAGVVMAVVTQFMLSLLGAGVGLAAIGPGSSAGGFGVGAAIWWSVSALIAMYTGGWFASRMAGSATAGEGAVHGVLTWGVSTLLTLFLFSTAMGKIVGGGFSLMGQAVGEASGSPALSGLAERELAERGIDVEGLAETARRDPKAAYEQLQRETRDERAQTRDAVGDARAEVSRKAEKAGDIGGMAAFFGFLSLGLGCIASAVGGRRGRTRPAAYASV